MFQHFGVTISLIFPKILVDLLILNSKIVITPNNSKMLYSYITNNAKYFFYFENCLETLDGTYLPAYFLAIIALHIKIKRDSCYKTFLKYAKLILYFVTF